MHLTNYSINKSNKEYKSNDDENACFGHKWYFDFNFEFYLNSFLIDLNFNRQKELESIMALFAKKRNKY